MVVCCQFDMDEVLLLFPVCGASRCLA